MQSVCSGWILQCSNFQVNIRETKWVAAVSEKMTDVSQTCRNGHSVIRCHLNHLCQDFATCLGHISIKIYQNLAQLMESGGPTGYFCVVLQGNVIKLRFGLKTLKTILPVDVSVYFRALAVFFKAANEDVNSAWSFLRFLSLHLCWCKLHLEELSLVGGLLLGQFLTCKLLNLFLLILLEPWLNVPLDIPTAP